MPARLSFGWTLCLILGMALLLGVGAGLLQADVLHLEISLPPTVVALGGAGVVGILFGLMTRIVLRGRTGTLRFLLSLLGLLVWMMTAGVTYAPYIGVRPLEYLTGADDWIEIGQIASGCLGILAISLVGLRSREAVPVRWSYAQGDQAPLPGVARSPLKWGLGANLALAAGLGVGLGLLQAGAFQPGVAVPRLAVALGGATVVGLLAGLTSRFTLRGWTETLRLLVTTLALLGWVVVAEATYALWKDADPLRHLARADNWVEMGQLALGIEAAIVAGLGRRRVGLVEVGQVEVGPGAGGARSRRARRSALFPRVSLPRVRWPLGMRHRFFPMGNSQVKVIARTEERCPYCLDVINRGDSRGVITCRFCGTPHHADCWEEGGGQCQVLHLNT